MTDVTVSVLFSTSRALDLVVREFDLQTICISLRIASFMLKSQFLQSDEWKGLGRVAGAKLKPDLVCLRRDSGDEWRKVVVDMIVASTEDMNEAFREKDDKYRK